MKKTGKEALAEIKELSKKRREANQALNKADKNYHAINNKFHKAIESFPVKERELYQEKIDKILEQ